MSSDEFEITYTECPVCWCEYETDGFYDMCPHATEGDCGHEFHAGEDGCQDCYRCERCCECEPPQPCPWEYVVPTDEDKAFAETMLKVRRYYEALVDPGSAMATFYLTEYILAHGSSPATAAIYDAAKQMQDDLVSLCDVAFRIYGYAAVGGELRHHYNASLPCDTDYPPRAFLDCNRRSGAGSAFFVLGEHYGYDTMLRHACTMFLDRNGWPDREGYGGILWRNCAEIILRRLTGQLDPKTFVDRCFALQHNGGSFLNKGHWQPWVAPPWRRSARPAEEYAGALADDCQTVGFAHSGKSTDLQTLMDYARPDAVALFREWVSARNRDNRHLCKPLFRIPDQIHTAHKSDRSGPSFWGSSPSRMEEIYVYGEPAGMFDLRKVHPDTYWLLGYDPEDPRNIKPGTYMPAWYETAVSGVQQGDLVVVARPAGYQESLVCGDVYRILRIDDSQIYKANGIRRVTAIPLSRPGPEITAGEHVFALAKPATAEFTEQFAEADNPSDLVTSDVCGYQTTHGLKGGDLVLYYGKAWTVVNVYNDGSLTSPEVTIKAASGRRLYVYGGVVKIPQNGVAE